MRITLAVAACLVLASTPAAAMGPVAEAGAVITVAESRVAVSGTTVDFNILAGPAVRVGLEVGERFNHQLDFEFTRASGQGGSNATPELVLMVPVSVVTLAGRYTFSVDFSKKRGFTPSVGIGLAVGQFQVAAAPPPEGNLRRYGAPFALYLELHALAGARYTFGSGFGLRGYVTFSTYGGFVALIPTLGASYRL